MDSTSTAISANLRARLDDVDDTLDGELLSIGVAAWDLLTEVRQALSLAQGPAVRRLSLMCQAFLIGKGTRVTRAMLTLVRYGQGEEALGLLREQHEFVTALLYYQKHQEAAALFTASHSIEQLQMAKRYLATAVSDTEKNDRSAHISVLQKNVDAALKRYPELVRPCGKDCSRRSNHVHFRKLPDHRAMMYDLLRDWLADAYAKEGTKTSKKALNHSAELISQREHLVHAHFISQEKHGLPFSLNNNLTIDPRTLEFGEVDYQVESPNDLAYHIIGSAAPLIYDSIAMNQLTALEPASEAWHASLERCKKRLSITDGNPALTRFRVA